MSSAVLVVIDHPCGSGAGEPFHEAAPDGPELLVTDAAVARGDGIFETAAVRGVIQAEQEHLARFARSAAMLDLPLPDLGVFADASRAAVAALADSSDAYVKYCMSRGDEHSQTGPTAWVYADRAPDHSSERTDGVRVVLLDRGYASTVRATSPWLLTGAKTLSYAVNKSALREAARRGADDVIFVAADGLVLEGPTSSLVARFGETLVTPPPESGVLAGTTQADVFTFADDLGLKTEIRDITFDELVAADALWLMSSIRLAVPIRELDGEPRDIDVELTDQFNSRLMGRTR